MGSPGLSHRLDDFEKEQDKNDGKDKAEAASTVVSETWTHAVTTEAEQQNQNKQKDEHFTFLRSARVRRSLCVMHISRDMSRFRNIYFMHFAASKTSIKGASFQYIPLNLRTPSGV
jgi:hypothetical protein